MSAYEGRRDKGRQPLGQVMSGGGVQGKGKHSRPDGSVYDGDWKNDKKHGRGKYVYGNGDTYEVCPRLLVCMHAGAGVRPILVSKKAYTSVKRGLY